MHWHVRVGGAVFLTYCIWHKLGKSHSMCFGLRRLKLLLEHSSQARSQVLRFGGEKYTFRGARFCFYFMLKTFFRAQYNLGRHKIFGGVMPLNSLPWPRAWFYSQKNSSHTRYQIVTGIVLLLSFWEFL